MKTLIPFVIFGCALWTIACPGYAAAPVHITLAAASVITPDADNFILLGSIATLAGGDPVNRKRMAAIEVGRAPLPGDMRRLDPGDVLLKLRQAGFQPEHDAVIDGAKALTVTITGAPPTPTPAAPLATPAPRTAVGGSDPSAPSSVLIHRGDAVVIEYVDGALSVTASGIAQEQGVLGQEIRVRRPGFYTDLIATVMDDRTVTLEP